MAPTLTTLPHEVMRKIAGFLVGAEHWNKDVVRNFNGYNNSVAQYATISKEWQEVLESFTFKNLHLTFFRIPQAAAILTARRRKFIHHIILDIVLPRCDMVACYHMENAVEKARNSQIADYVVSSLFNLLLSTWKKEEVRASGIELVIGAFSPSDNLCTSLYNSEPDQSSDDDDDAAADDDSTGIIRGNLNKRFEGSFLNLSTPLPQAECVSRFTIGRYTSMRNFSSHSYWSLLRALPNLETLELDTWEIQHPQPIHREGSCITRLNTYKVEANWIIAYLGFLSSIPPALKVLRFSFTDFTHNQPCFWPRWDIDYIGYIRQMTKDGRDVLSCTLREMSYGLTTLQIRGPIGPQFFWPPEGSEEDTPYWPNLKSLGAFIYFYLPGGTWLFEHVGGSGDGVACDKCFWETNEDSLNELYSTVARSVHRMPKLEVLALRTVLEAWIFHDFRFQVIGRRAFLGWRSTPMFHPSDEVLRLWEEVADSRGLKLDVIIIRARAADTNDDQSGTRFMEDYESEKYCFGWGDAGEASEVGDDEDSESDESSADEDSESSGTDDAEMSG